jgi:hypothetical protein
MFSRTLASPSGVGSKSSGMTLPPEMPSRHDPGSIDPGNEKDIIGDRLQDLEKLRGEDISIAGPDGDDDAVGPAKLIAVLEVGLHVLVLER